MSDDKDEGAAPASKAGKLDTLNKFNDWLNQYHPSSRTRLAKAIEARPALLEITRSQESAWWVKREVARSMYEFGQTYHQLPSEVVALLVHYDAVPNYYHFVHLSLTDPTKIAYTPTWEDGAADRQVQISLGKYIKKYHPHVPEFVVKRCQEYLNNLLVNAEVKFTTDLALMISIYRNCSPACMSKPKEHFLGNVHPLGAYIYEGWQLAYLQKADQTYQSRAMIWTNPKDNTDKRYTRVYGDALLAAQLDKLGFRRTNFLGARLRRIDVQSDNSQQFCAVPYIDDHGTGIQGTGIAHWYVVHDDYVEVVTNGTPGAQGCNAEGRIEAPPWKPRIVGAILPHVSKNVKPCEELYYEVLPDRSLNVGVTMAISDDRRGNMTLVDVICHFPDQDRLDQHTVPRAFGGRFLFNAELTSSFRIGIVKSTNGMIDHKIELINGRQDLVGLSSMFYPSIVVHTAKHKALFPCVAAPEEIFTDKGILKTDAVIVTAGSASGRVTHRSRTRVYKNAVYLRTDFVTDYFNGALHPHEVCTRINDAAFGPNAFVGPEVKVDTSTRMPLFHGAGTGALDLLDAEEGMFGEPFRTSDSFVLYHRERGVACGFPTSLHEWDNWNAFVKSRDFQLAMKCLVPHATERRFLFTHSLTREDHLRTLEIVNSDIWNALAVIMMNNGSDGLGLGRELPMFVYAMIKERLIKRSRNALDNSPESAETLHPQPETAVEQSAPVSAVTARSDQELRA